MPAPDITIALNDHNYNKNEKVDKSVMLPAFPLPVVKPPIIESVKECVGHYAKNDLRTEHVVRWSGKEELHDRIFKRKTYKFALAGKEVSIESSTYANKETFSQELCHALNPNEVRYIPSVEPMSIGRILKRPIRPSLTVIASQEDEEGFEALRKYGTGVTSDRELINQASTTAFAVDKDADERRYSRNKTARTGMHCCKRNGERISKSGRRKGSKEVGSEKYFLWQDWKIDGIFLNNYSGYLQGIVRKWSTLTELNEESKMLEALLKENEENVNRVSTFNSINFFLEVFTNYLHIKSKFPNRSMDQKVEELKNLLALNARESSVHIPSLVLKEKQDVQRKVPRKGTQSYGWVEKIKSLMGHEKQADPTPTIEANLTEQFTPGSIVSGNEGIVRQKTGTRVIKIDLLEKLDNISHIKQVKTLKNRNKNDEGLVRQCCNVADQIIAEEWMEFTHTGKENTVEEYVPTEEEIKEEMEVREFGVCMLPKTIRSAERLGDKNKIECDLCEDQVMLALDCLLEKIRGKESGESSLPVFKKCSCRKKRKRKMKSSDMEYIPSFHRKNNVPGGLRIRKSNRLRGNQSELVGRICEVDQQDLNDYTFRPELNQALSEACPQSKEDSKEDEFVSKPPRADINKNYLKNMPEFDPSEQIVTKTKYSQKITKFLRQQKKKSNRLSNRKYSGFELKTVSGKAPVEIAGSQTEKVTAARKAQISKEEADIIDDLLHDLESEFIEKPPNVSVLPNFYGMEDAFCGDTINEFQEFQTMGEITVFTPNFHELMDI